MLKVCSRCTSVRDVCGIHDLVRSRSRQVDVGFLLLLMPLRNIAAPGVSFLEPHPLHYFSLKCSEAIIPFTTTPLPLWFPTTVIRPVRLRTISRAHSADTLGTSVSRTAVRTAVL